MLRKLDPGVAAVFFMVLVTHLLLRNAVEKYYASHLPHYDSIGSYTFACEVLNACANEGWWAGIKLATGFGLSLTQPMFAAAVAPFLQPTPQSLLVYNSLCLALLSWSLYALCRALGGGALKCLAAAVSFEGRPICRYGDRRACRDEHRRRAERPVVCKAVPFRLHRVISRLSWYERELDSMFIFHNGRPIRERRPTGDSGDPPRTSSGGTGTHS